MPVSSSAKIQTSQLWLTGASSHFKARYSQMMREPGSREPLIDLAYSARDMIICCAQSLLDAGITALQRHDHTHCISGNSIFSSPRKVLLAQQSLEEFPKKEVGRVKFGSFQ